MAAIGSFYQSCYDSSDPTTCITHFTAPTFNDNFFLYEADAYANFRYTPGFSGRWDFTSAVVMADGSTGVPEPATWTLVIGGISMLGGCLRRRRADRSAGSPQATIAPT